jgi:hypothetical protein
LGDVADGLAAFGEAPDHFVLLGGGQVLEADAIASEGALDGDLVEVVVRACMLGVVSGVWVGVDVGRLAVSGQLNCVSSCC